MSWYWWLLIMAGAMFVSWVFGWMQATVQSIQIHRTWMSNSWALLAERLWWIKATNWGESISPEEFNSNLVQTLQDYNDVFGRDYSKEDPIPHPAESNHEPADP